MSWSNKDLPHPPPIYTSDDKKFGVTWQNHKNNLKNLVQGLIMHNIFSGWFHTYYLFYIIFIFHELSSFHDILFWKKNNFARRKNENQSKKCNYATLLLLGLPLPLVPLGLPLPPSCIFPVLSGLPLEPGGLTLVPLGLSFSSSRFLALASAEASFLRLALSATSLSFSACFNLRLSFTSSFRILSLSSDSFLLRSDL